MTELLLAVLCLVTGAAVGWFTGYHYGTQDERHRWAAYTSED